MTQAGASGSAEGTSRSWQARLRAGARDAPGTAVLGGLVATAFVVTLGRCGTAQGWDALATSVWSLARCDAELETMGALDLGRVWVDGEWWRVSTAGLLHGSWVHLILNIWSLVVVGPWVERAWGTVRMLVAFGLASVLGCVASVAWAEAPVVVGASAGVLGLAGLLFVGRRFGSPETKAVLEPISAGVLGWTLLVLVALGFFVPVIAQAGHLGGLLAGGVLGAAWRGGGRRGGGWGVPAVAGLLAVGVQVGRAPEHRTGYFEFSGHRLLVSGDHARAAVAFERALEADPDDPQLCNAVAYAYAEAGVELERAEALVAVSLEAEPENADFLDTLGWIHCQAGRAVEGRAVLERAVAEADGDVSEIEEHLAACSD